MLGCISCQFAFFYPSNNSVSVEYARRIKQEVIGQHIPAASAGLTRRYRQYHHRGFCKENLAALYRLEDFDIPTIAGILLFFFHCHSRLHWKPILYHVARASNEADQTDRDKRVRHCVHWRRHYRDGRSLTGGCRSQ